MVNLRCSVDVFKSPIWVTPWRKITAEMKISGENSVAENNVANFQA